MTELSDYDFDFSEAEENMNSVGQDSSAASTISASFNLVAAIANLANPTGVAAVYTRDLLRWLERSGVNEANFQRCMTYARGLAYPNENGMMLSHSIDKAKDKLQRLKRGQLPMPLTWSYALGRLIMKQPDLYYLASTTASLMTHHDPKYVQSALTSMIFDKDAHRGPQNETEHVRWIYRRPSEAVIGKIVDSIFLHVSNAGHQAMGLPPELASLHVHTMGPTEFAAIVMQVQRSRRNLVLRADRFPGDVILWLLNHFEGLVEVYVGSPRIYKATLGSGPHDQKFTAIIKENCPDDHSKCDNRSWPVLLSETISGQPHTLFQEASSQVLKACSYQRQKLYDTENLMKTSYISYKVYHDREQQNSIRHTARRITKWLMCVPTSVKDWPQVPGFCFRTELELNEDRDRTSDFNVEHFLYRSPRLLQEKTGESTSKAPIFRRPEWQGSPISSQNTESDKWGSGATPEEVLKNFPGAEDLLEDMQKHCQCANCRSKGSLSNSKKGCLRYSAALQLCILISHAVADALGVDDVSGAPDPENAMSGVITLLSEIIDREILRWDTWFQVAVCAVTGCSWDSFDDATANSEEKDSTSWAGVQYGSIAVLAPWLDFRAPCDIRESFRIHIYEASIEGIKEDVALIQTEQASSDDSESFERIEAVVGSWERLALTDETSFEVQRALFPVRKSLHKLMVVVIVNDRFRIVDPTQSMINLSRSEQVFCEHRRHDNDQKHLQDTMGLNFEIKTCTLGKIFDQWSTESQGSSWPEGIASPEFSLVFDEPRRLHISLALSGGGVILRNTKKCCLACATKHFLRMETERKSFKLILSFDNFSRRQIERRLMRQIDFNRSASSPLLT